MTIVFYPTAVQTMVYPAENKGCLHYNNSQPLFIYGNPVLFQNKDFEKKLNV